MLALCLASKCRGCVCKERSCVLQIIIAPNRQWRFPVWESCVDKLVEILLCEGGDVELYARTSKHVRVFAIDPLSLTLSITLCLASFILSYHTCMLGCDCLCASLLSNHESFI